jgi:hypothetical protein
MTQAMRIWLIYRLSFKPNDDERSGIDANVGPDGAVSTPTAPASVTIQAISH